jgi:hypothetical protein
MFIEVIHIKKELLLKLIMIITAVCIILVFPCSCNSSEKIKYYSQKENYISVAGTVSSIKYNEDSTALYVDFSELSPMLDDTCFKIVGENLEIVQGNNIDDKLKTDEQITFITAPKYFGDGYVMPMVAISIGEENLLEFEDGYENLLTWLEDTYKEG